MGVTQGEMTMWSDVRRIADELHELVKQGDERGAHHDRLGQVVEQLDRLNGNLEDRDEDGPLMRIAVALEKMVAVPAQPPQPGITGSHWKGSYHVEDIVTGRVMSRDFSTKAEADSACGQLNLQSTGGRYGVYDHEGGRA